MNDMNTHAHSDAMVIDADTREEYQQLCEEYLDQKINEELNCVELCEEWPDGQPTEYEEWQGVYDGDDWDHGQFDGEEW